MPNEGYVPPKRAAELLSRRSYLVIAAMAAGAESGEYVSWPMALEAVSSTAMANGWDLEEMRTWEEWVGGDAPE